MYLNGVSETFSTISEVKKIKIKNKLILMVIILFLSVQFKKKYI